MRKIASLLTVLILLCSMVVSAQERTVTGVVSDEKGSPVPFASVVIKSTKKGVIADQNGLFSIKANVGDVLVVTSQGRVDREITVGASNTLNVSLDVANDAMKEVVISTGYNTKKTQRSATSNAQNVNAEQLTTIRQANLNNALAGKVAGIQIRSQAVGKLGSDAAVRLRGDGNIGGQSVLYVVDGTVTNSVDINPDDVEDLTVLNGPAAAAIYGPQAADGVIVVNTKRAKRNQKGAGVEVNTGVTFDKIYILPNYQNEYAGGGVSDLIQYNYVAGHPVEWQALDGKYYHDYTDDASWGPKMDGSEYIPWYAWYPGTKYTGKTAPLIAQPDNARDFYRTGVTLNNNVSFSKAGDGYNARFSYTNLDIKGLVPRSYLKRHTIAFNTNVDLSKNITVGANINYVAQNQQAENDDAYSNNSTGSFNSWFHRNLDMDILEELKGMTSPFGHLGSWNHANPTSYNTNPANFYKGNYWYNFFSYFDNVENLFRRDRLYGDVNITYRFNNKFRIRGAYRKNQVSTWTENRKWYILETSQTQTGERAAYGTSETYFRDDRMELTGIYSEKIKDFSVDAIVGGEIVKIQSKNVSAATRDGLYIPDYFALNNSISTITYGNGRSEEKRRAAFVRGSVGWKNMIFGEFTLRNDWFSTLPVGDNDIFVKSFGGSFVFSDMIKDKMPWLSYGKVRIAWGEVPQPLGVYSVVSGYSVSADQWNGNFTMSTPNTLIDPGIQGAVQATTEFGLDLRFLKSRAGISATFYTSKTSNSPISAPINGASGYSSKLINAGEIQRKGIEFQLNGKPFTKEFTWDINVAFAKILDNKVVALAPGVNQITLSSGAAFGGIPTPIAVHQVGQPWGMLIGGGKTYIDGQVVLDAAGNYVPSQNVRFGSVLPDYTGGVQNSFSYKNIVLNVNIDFQKGGKFFSLSDMWGAYSGLTARTAAINDKGNNIRDAVADGGGVHVVGIDANKNKIDMYVEAQDYFHNMVGLNVFDEFIYDLTFVKMRELSLGYRLPVEKWKGVNKWLQNATLSFVGRNLWLIHSSTKDFDPSEISSTFGENGQFPGTRSYGFNLRLGF